MKSICNGRVGALIGMIVFCGFWMVEGGPLFAAPRIEVEQPVLNFGVVTNLSELVHDFVIRNTGDAPVQVSRVLSSCNVCLQAGMANLEIPPGGSNAVHCHLDLRLLRGNVSRVVLVECNDPSNPAVALTLEGTVVPCYQVIPSELSIDIAQGETAATANISPLIPLRAGLSQVVCDDTNIEAGISAAPFTGFLLSVRLKTMPPRGDSVVRLTLRSSDSNDPPCQLTVGVHHPEDLEWLPPRLVFQPQAWEQVRVLLLRQHGTNPLTLLDVVPSSNKYHCEIEPMGWNYRIYVTAVGQDAAADQTNSLLLKFRNSANERTNAAVPVGVEGP